MSVFLQRLGILSSESGGGVSAVTDLDGGVANQGTISLTADGGVANQGTITTTYDGGDANG